MPSARSPRSLLATMPKSGCCERAVENFVEDPLGEELLKGEFQGKDTILVDAIKDDEDKPRRLDFKGLVTNHQAQQPEPVAAAGETK